MKPVTGAQATGGASVPAPPPRDEATPIRVVCIDDDTLIRVGVATLLPGLDVVATYPHVEDLLAAPVEADVVLLDLCLADGLDSETVPALLQGADGVVALAQAGYRVLIYTNERRRLVLAGCLAAGAVGVVHKVEPLEHVVEAAQQVAAGEIVITAALAGLAEVVERHGQLPRLSPRQLDVLRLRARGETYKGIGRKLFISAKTAEEYMGEVNRRFADYLVSHSPADLERLLGVGAGDLLDRGGRDRRDSVGRAGPAEERNGAPRDGGVG